MKRREFLRRAGVLGVAAAALDVDRAAALLAPKPAPVSVATEVLAQHDFLPTSTWAEMLKQHYTPHMVRELNKPSILLGEA